LKMEKSERTMNAKPKLMAADAVRLSGFILITQIQTHYHWPEWFLRKGWKECQVWVVRGMDACKGGKVDGD
jgi:hypothetical protein